MDLESLRAEGLESNHQIKFLVYDSEEPSKLIIFGFSMDEPTCQDFITSSD